VYERFDLGIRKKIKEGREKKKRKKARDSEIRDGDLWSRRVELAEK